MDMDDALKHMPMDEMNDFELRYAELKNIEWVLIDMHSVIEGGEAREDYETTLASHHFTEIDDYLSHRLSRVRDAIEWMFSSRDLFKFMGRRNSVKEKGD